MLSVTELDLECGSSHPNEVNAPLLSPHSMSSQVDQHATWSLYSLKPFTPLSPSFSFRLLRRTGFLLLALVCSMGLAAHSIHPFLLHRASRLRNPMRSLSSRIQTKIALWPVPRQNLTTASNRYVAFQVSPNPFAAQSTSFLKQNEALSAAALELLFNPTDSKWLPESLHIHFPKHSKFDIVHTWVNGSDPLHLMALAAAESTALLKRQPPNGYQIRTAAAGIRHAVEGRANFSSKLFRDHDELRYSLRSVLQHFRRHTRGFHLLATQFPEPTAKSAQVETSTTRYGQLPQWLTRKSLSDSETWLSSSLDDALDLRIHHHAQYSLGSQGRATFSSFAIESMLAKVPGLSEHFIYMNDDYFFTADLSPADFYTPQYGIVLRMWPGLVVTSANPAAANDDPHGEWRALHYSNWLLDQRFGPRPRPYIVHGPKAMSLSILAELSILPTSTFAVPLLRTSRHTFRAQYTGVSGHDDAFVTFLFSHYIVERWREVLLWSWVVGRIGGKEGEWRDNIERKSAWRALGGASSSDEEADEGDEDEDADTTMEFLTVKIGQRDTLDESTVNSVLRRKKTGTSPYVYSSLDGYPYAHIHDHGQHDLPQYTAKSAWSKANPRRPRLSPVCEVRLEQCFPTGFKTSSDAFEFIAFEWPECGDCIVQALINKSGNIGLSAILPSPDRNISFSASHCRELPCTDEGVSAPHLPFGAEWRHNDYSIRSVLAPWASNITSGEPVGWVNVRQWVMQAMARYRFVVGDTPTEFLQITTPANAREWLGHIDRNKNVAMVCLNDDMVADTADKTSSIVTKWMKARFPTPAGWEERGS